MLRMNAACSLVFFTAVYSPPLPTAPSANDSSQRCVKNRLHTESSSHGCTSQKKIERDFLFKFQLFQKNGRCGDVSIYIQSPVSSHPQKKPSLVPSFPPSLPSVMFFYISEIQDGHHFILFYFCCSLYKKWGSNFFFFFFFLQLSRGLEGPSRWPKATSPLQELEVGAHRAPYLLVNNIDTVLTLLM